MALATAIYHNDLSAARVVSADSLAVYAIVIANTTAGVIDYEFTNAAGTQILAITVPADNTFALEISDGFVTQGLTVAAEASTSILTVFYRPGA